MKIEMNEGASVACLFFAIAIVLVTMLWALGSQDNGEEQVEIKKLELAIAQYSAKEK